MRYGASFVGLMLEVSVAAAEVPGQSAGIAASIGEYDPRVEEAEEPAFVPRFDGEWRWGGVLEAYGGILVHRVGGELSSHAAVGGAARLRYGLLTLGAFHEVSDLVERGRWKSSGGFGGVHVPFTNWVDIDAVVGGGLRTHEDDELRYGPNGYTWTTPTLLFRLAVSDRTGDALVAARVGAELFASFDLHRGKQAWRYEFATTEGVEPRVVSGETDVGGYSIGIAVTLGLDFAEPTSSSSRPRISG
jgi:hypothetical protein